MSSDTLFKGMTRTPTFMGVPMVPFFFVVSFFVLIAIFFNLYLIVGAVPVVYGMQLLSKYDDKIFTIYFLKLFKIKKSFRSKLIFKGLNNYNYMKYRENSINENKRLNFQKEGLKMNLKNGLDFSWAIPYSSHISNDLVYTKEGDLVATWVCEGILFESVDNEDLIMIKNQINTMIQSLTNSPISIYHHNVSSFINDSLLSTSIRNSFSQNVNELYLNDLGGSKLRSNHLYISVVYRTVESKLNKAQPIAVKKQHLNDCIKEFNTLLSSFDSGLKKFNAHRLATYTENEVVFSEQLEFYNYLVTGNKQKIRVTNEPIYNYLGNTSIYFAQNTAEIQNYDRKKFFKCIEIKEYPAETYQGILDSLLYLNIEYVMTHSMSLMPRFKSMKEIDKQFKRLISAEDNALSQIEELEEAKDDLASGKLGFGLYNFSFVVFAESVSELDKNVGLVMSSLSNLGIISSIANIAMEATYFSQLPANFELRTRLSLISTKNFASLIGLHGFAIGKKNQNPWGEAITLLTTPSGHPYYLNFHSVSNYGDDFNKKPLGHTLLVGSSGSGKTVNLTFFLTQMQKYANIDSFPVNSESKRFTSIFLDKDHGAEIFINAVGGRYINIRNGMPTGFNPFMCENTSENITFLRELMTILVTRGGEILSADDESKLNHAILSVMSYEKEDRRFGISRLLENITEPLEASEKRNSLKKRLMQWQNSPDNPYGWVFDNEYDLLDFDGFDNFGIDGTEFLDNKVICAPLAFYLLHRIRQLADGRRLVIVIDEFWKWLNDDAFASFAQDGLNTFRKLNSIIVFATQSPDQILGSSIARTIIQQIATNFYLPNSKAERKEYVDGFSLTEKEFELIKNLDPDSRQFLIKKGHYSNLAKLDLSGQKGNLNILSTSEDNLVIFNKIMSKYRKESHEVVDPSIWIDEFKSQFK